MFTHVCLLSINLRWIKFERKFRENPWDIMHNYFFFKKHRITISNCHTLSIKNRLHFLPQQGKQLKYFQQQDRTPYLDR